MKVLIDTNVVLDLLLEREPFVETAIKIFLPLQNLLIGWMGARLRRAPIHPINQNQQILERRN